MDLIEILNLRVEKALDHKKVESASIRKIAAYASRETGDARRAVELLAKAVRIAEETSGMLTEVEVDRADSMLEIDKTVEMSSANTGMRLCLAINYGGRAELADTMRSIAEEVRDGRLDPSEITGKTLSHNFTFVGEFQLLSFESRSRSPSLTSAL